MGFRLAMMTISLRTCLLSLGVAALVSGCALFSSPPEEGQENQNAQAVPDGTGTTVTDIKSTLPDDKQLRIEVYKDKREIVLKRGQVAIGNYDVRLGRNPKGKKLERGDSRTPEGRYRVCEVRPSKYKAFIWFNYPNEEDANLALREGRLNTEQHRRILTALKAGQCPPSDTPLGGLVGIHGDEEEPPRRYNWTQGCIALISNHDVLHLAKLIRPGTPVVIHP